MLHFQIDVVGVLLAAHSLLCSCEFPGRMVWHSIIPFPAHNCGRAANLIPNLHSITIYGASIHPRVFAGAILAVLTAPWRNWQDGVQIGCYYYWKHHTAGTSTYMIHPVHWAAMPLPISGLIAHLDCSQTCFLPKKIQNFHLGWK